MSQTTPTTALTTAESGPGVGPLGALEQIRPQLVSSIAAQTAGEFERAPLDLLLGDALYRERIRLKRNKRNIFTWERNRADKKLWGKIQTGLLQPPGIVDRKELLHQVSTHYADEIAGHFNPSVYRFATHAVPFGFNWLLNAASLKKYRPWGLEEKLKYKIRILGETAHLQRLYNKGTVLLVPTHQSNLDSILIGYIVYLLGLPPFSYGAGLNLFSNPMLAYFMSNLGSYTVDRNKSSEIYKQVLKNYSTQTLRSGIHSIFFPGGGRSRSGALESRLKLGLLGTGLKAQIANMQEGKPNPSVFIVPMVTSYHFVLEAASLIEDYLMEAGKARFIITDDESDQFTQVLRFFWNWFLSEREIVVRLGKPLDVFGNLVDEEGRSMGPNGTVIDAKKWLTTRGEVCEDQQRDQEYTRELGERLVERYHKDNVVLSSHAVAFTLFELLRKQYPDLDLYRFLRLSLAQRSMMKDKFMEEARRVRDSLQKLENNGMVYLSEAFQNPDPQYWIEDGIRNLGFFHRSKVVMMKDGEVWTEDMNLLYYYRNRLAGYGISLLANSRKVIPGQNDSKGFLA